ALAALLVLPVVAHAAQTLARAKTAKWRNVLITHLPEIAGDREGLMPSCRRSAETTGNAGTRASCRIRSPPGGAGESNATDAFDRTAGRSDGGWCHRPARAVLRGLLD